MKEKTIKITPPNSTALLLAILVIVRVCAFSVKVVEPAPVPHSPASTLQKPSKPIPLLTIPRVGGVALICIDAE